MHITSRNEFKEYPGGGDLNYDLTIADLKKISPTAQSKDTTSSLRSDGMNRTGAKTGQFTAPVQLEVQPCRHCGRKFATDRVKKHENICQKTVSKKRKPYNIIKHRVTGTEAEPFLRQIRKTKKEPGSQTKIGIGCNSWRKKHEEFISNIRAAKLMKAHLAAGGKVSDLPPPPPSENPDYVQCPHCGRRFNQRAAERHIPQCASFQFNKPRATPRQPARKR